MAANGKRRKKDMVERMYATIRELMETLGATWRRIRPTLEFWVLSIQVWLLELADGYRNEVDRRASRIEERAFPGNPRISRLYANLFLWLEMILAVFGSIFFVAVYFPWYRELSAEEVEALQNLSIAFVVIAIMLAIIIRSIIRRGVIQTIFRGVCLIIAIKGITLILAWLLTLDLGIATPEMDNVIGYIIQLPDIVIIATTQKFIPWVIENYNFLFG